MRVDLETKTIEASVRELAEWPPPPPRPGGRLLYARARVGQEAHRLYRARFSSHESFRPELAVVLEHECDGFAVTVRGRADGVFVTEDAVLVEEVKAAAVERPEHRFQVRLYALALQRDHPDKSVRARLVLDGSSIAVPFDAARMRRELDDRLREIIVRARHDAMRAARRAALAEELRFPFDEPRPGQQAMMDAIARGLEAGRPVLVSAPTGTGKTVAALVPALRHTLKENATLFFATAKTTQQALVAKMVPPGVRALTLRAKRSMCPPGTLHCHPQHCSFLRNALVHERRRHAIDALLTPGGHISASHVNAMGSAAIVCPYALSLALAQKVDLVIGDVNYAFGSGTALDFGRTVVVVDEAHNLFDRARDDYSPFIRTDTVARLRDRLFDGRLTVGPLSLFDRIDRFLARADREDVGDEAAQLMLDYAAEEPDADDELIGVLASAVRVRDLLAEGSPEFVRHETEEGRGVLCLDPSRKLAEKHEQRLGTVAMSATLEPMDHFRTVLGFSDLAPVECRVGSPFPREHRRVLAVRGIDTTWKRRSGYYGKVAKQIGDIIDVRPGHYVAYFPSFTFLDAVRGLLAVPRDRLIVQQPTMSPRERRSVLARMRDEPGPLLLLAVTGGIFSEGVDLPGDALIGAIVVGPGLPRSGPERDAMRRYFDETTGSGFLHAHVYPGMQRVVQAAGRVHRTQDDRGAIILLGQRFLKRPYADCLPHDWQVEDVHDPVPPLQEFWSS